MDKAYKALEAIENDINNALARSIKLRRNIARGKVDTREIIKQLSLIEEELER